MSKGIIQESIAIVALLKSCAKQKDLCKGSTIHANILKRGLLAKSPFIGSSLVSMYAKCGALAKAQQVLDELPVCDVVIWNSLIAGFTQHGKGVDALNCFERMQREGIHPNAVTFVCILKVCGSMGAVEKGEQMHDMIVKRGLLGTNVVLGTALVDMYAKCGALAKAQQVLNELPARNVVTWSALIAGYAQHGHGKEALDCFEQMQCCGICPNIVTFISVLKACGIVGAGDKGKQIHDEIVRQGLLGTNVVLDTALVDMYAKCGMLEKAAQVLNELPVRNVVTWSALIAGYAQHGQEEEALNSFQQMQHEGFYPNAITFTCILKACGSIAAADKGEQIHNDILRQGLLRTDIVLGNALVDMYAKCGVLAKAQQVLEELPVRDAVTWSALIAGYAQHGHGKEALHCFERMQCEGLSPDAVTFVSVLNACSQSCLIDEGQMYFANMSKDYAISPGVEHYTCMVDLFGRTGHFDRAIAVIKKMSSFEYHPVWSTLLDACQKWGNVKLARLAFEHAIQLDKKDVAAYALMSNIYAAAGMHEEADKIEAMRIK